MKIIDWDVYHCNSCNKEFAVINGNDPVATPCCESVDFDFIEEVTVNYEKVKRPPIKQSFSNRK